MPSLEAATSRLEDLADEQARRGSSASTNSIEPAPTTYSTPVPPPPPPAPTPAPAPALAAEVPRSVTAFDETVIAEKFKPFVELTQSLGGPLIQQVSICSASGNATGH